MIFYDGWNKKSTYNPVAQKKYDQKQKKIACTVFNAKYEIIKKRVQEKGFTSINSYVLDLIDNDLKSDSK